MHRKSPVQVIHGSRVITVALLIAAVSGCASETTETTLPVPRVKTTVVDKLSTGQSRKLSGRIEAADRSTLSFGVAGRITEILVKRGDQVSVDQELARLDAEPFRLELESRRAAQSNARAAFVQAEAEYKRTKELREQQAASQRDLDTAQASLATAHGQLKSAESALDAAELDLEHTRLLAPFSGQVLEVPADPFQEVSSGAEILTLQADGALKVELLVPETLIRNVDYGQEVAVEFPTMEGLTASGTVSLIGAAAESGNGFPVTVRLSPSDADLRPGMSATVTFNFAAYLESQTAYLIPVSALAIEAALASQDPAQQEDKKGQAPLFVFNPEKGVVEFRTVRIGDLRGNEIEVFEGLEKGEQVITAGVSFLRDGMQAEAWIPRR